MGDFVEQTALEPIGNRRYRAVLSEDWMLWGPAGGYVSAIALRAAGVASSFRRPVSYACQYVNVARFDAVDLQVESLRRGKRTEALRVSMTQDEKLILTAQVWAMVDVVRLGAGFMGYGHYHEEYRKVEGDWRIARLRLTRLHIEGVEPPVD